jgi:hypothetical protein
MFGVALFLFLIAVFFTILTWKRIGSVHGMSWIQTSTGEPTLFGFRGSVSSSLDSMTSRVPAGLWGRARHFAFSTSTGSRSFYFQILLWSVVGVFFRLRAPDDFYVLVFAVPLLLPVVGVGLPLNVSQRMFMLPMNRARGREKLGLFDSRFIREVMGGSGIAVQRSGAHAQK